MAVGEENTVVNTHLSLFLELLSIFTSIKSQEDLTRLDINTNNTIVVKTIDYIRSFGCSE